MIGPSLRNLQRDERGVSAIEFGILSVPLLVMLMGFGEMGYESYVKSNLQGTLNDVARAAVVESPKVGTGTDPIETRIKDEVKARMETLVKGGTYNFDLLNYTNFDQVGKPEALVTDVNGNGQYDAGDCWEDSNANKTFDLDSGSSGLGGADDVMVYNVKLTATHLFPIQKLIGGGDTFDVSASALVRIQPYGKQREPEVEC